ncbi:MAG: hypothetical protein AAGE76_06280 [Pseudomonadota bacterium]
MSKFDIGDVVMLASGSPRLTVERIEGDEIHVLWWQEGMPARASLSGRLLRKPPPRDDDGGRRPPGDKPRGKPGWDGKPREKKYFRKD